MKFTKKFFTCLAMALLMMSITVTAFAAEGTTDWGKGVIRVIGNGVGKAKYKNKSPGQYLLTAQQAARMDAQRKLAEYAMGVQVSATSSMTDLALDDDTVKTRLNSVILKNAVQIGEAKYYEDGRCEIVMELNLYGGVESVAEIAFTPYKTEPKVSFPAPVDITIINQPTVVSNNYTGLIIDCSGLGGLNPVMSPVIRNANGQAIYGHQNLDYDKIIVNGMASYAEDAYDQISRSRAGNNPLIIKAIRLDDHSANPVVSVADADKILAANQYDGFLDNCAVVFIR